MRLGSAFALVLAACGHAAAPAGAPVSAHVAKLKSPAAADPAARGAAYLGQVALQLQPGWGQFLDDCRLRLPVDHPLNAMTLTATADIAIDGAGQVVAIFVKTSGNADFDRAVREAIEDASPLPRPPESLWSDDDRVHLTWLFARDRRQAGPATAHVSDVELPLGEVIKPWLAMRQLARLARRIARAPMGAHRDDAIRRLVDAVLEEAARSPDGQVRWAATQAYVRVHAVRASDGGGSLEQPPPPKLPVPSSAIGQRLYACTQAGGASIASAAPRIEKGLRDGDRSVRAACVDALVAQLRQAPDDKLLHAVGKRIGELVHDRDIDVRARAVVAQLLLDTHASTGIADEPAPEVRAAFAGELGAHFYDPRAVDAANALITDRAPDVRAAAWRSLAAHPERIADAQAAQRAAAEPSPDVRQVAVRVLDDDDLLEKLAAADESPSVRTEALVRLAERRGRAAMEPRLLEQIAAAPPASAERVRAALAWLLAR